MTFVLVKPKDGPQAPFYVGSEELSVNPDLYVVVDDTEVDQPRAILTEPAKAPKTSPGTEKKNEEKS